MSPYIQQAIVAAEDARFYDHHGVDIRGVARAFVANDQAGGVSQGASTLTMQYVRNALRDGADDTRGRARGDRADAGRKIREMKLALELETKMTKTQILEGYLNLAYFGHRAYGIDAAAAHLLLHHPEQADAGPGRDDRRSRPGADHVRPDRLGQEGRAGAAELRDRAGWQASATSPRPRPPRRERATDQAEAVVAAERLRRA